MRLKKSPVAADLERPGALRDVSTDRIRATKLAGEPIGTKLTQAPGSGAAFGGVKVSAANGWFAARPSGTEALYKIYAESFCSPDHLRQIQGDAKAMVESLLGEQIPSQPAEV